MRNIVDLIKFAYCSCVCSMVGFGTSVLLVLLFMLSIHGELDMAIWIVVLLWFVIGVAMFLGYISSSDADNSETIQFNKMLKLNESTIMLLTLLIAVSTVVAFVVTHVWNSYSYNYIHDLITSTDASNDEHIIAWLTCVLRAFPVHSMHDITGDMIPVLALQRVLTYTFWILWGCLYNVLGMCKKK